MLFIILCGSSTLLSLWHCCLRIPSLLSRIWCRCRLVGVPLSEPLHIHSSCLSSRRLFLIFSSFPSSVQPLCTGGLESSKPSICYYVPMVIFTRLVACSLPLIILVLLSVDCPLFFGCILGSSFSIWDKKLYNEGCIIQVLQLGFFRLRTVSTQAICLQICDGTIRAIGYNFSIGVSFTVEFSVVSICLVRTDLPHTKHVHSTKKHRSYAIILTVLRWAPHSELNNLCNQVFLEHTFRFTVTWIRVVNQGQHLDNWNRV